METFNGFKTWKDSEAFLKSLVNYRRDTSEILEGQKKCQGEKTKNNEERNTGEKRKD